MKFWLVRLGSVALAVLGCLLLDQVVSGGSSTFVQRLVVLAGLYVTLSVSLNLINGITGQFSIGHAAFYQIGAYAAAILARQFHAPAGMPPSLWLILMIVAGSIAAGIAGFVVGLPSLRLRGDYLAIVTLGFGEIIRIVVQAQQPIGGAYGMQVAPRYQHIWLVWLLAIVCIAVCRNLLKTARGLTFLAVREDEIASSAMGVNVTAVKVTSFVLGSAFAGAAGALFAHFEGFVSPAMFTMDVSFIIVTMVVLGGTGSITGAAIAAVLLFYLPEKMRDLENVRMGQVLAGAVVLVVGTWALRQIASRFHGAAIKRVGLVAGTLVGVVVLFMILGPILSSVPQLKTLVEGSKLRLVVFAVTLVVLMLVRPQGIFGHHEFSWSWVGRLLGRKTPRTEVSAS
ncbi:MAG: branched-chain amino acid ABC transporter permease [Fimbriimonas sp.]